jgi:hypothetical protein
MRICISNAPIAAAGKFYDGIEEIEAPSADDLMTRAIAKHWEFLMRERYAETLKRMLRNDPVPKRQIILASFPDGSIRQYYGQAEAAEASGFSREYINQLRERRAVSPGGFGFWFPGDPEPVRKRSGRPARDCRTEGGVQLFRCRGCEQWLPRDDYYADKRCVISGLAARCKQCVTEYEARRRRRNNENKRKRRTGLSSDSARINSAEVQMSAVHNHHAMVEAHAVAAAPVPSAERECSVRI